VDELRARRARRYVAIILILIVGPSGFTFYNVISESIFNRRVNTFITENVYYDGAELVKNEVVYKEGQGPVITLSFFGENVPASLIKAWRSKLDDYGLDNADIRVFQGGTVAQMNSEEVTKLVDVYTDSRKEIQSKDETIARLKLELERQREHELPVAQLCTELQVMYPRLHSLSLAWMVEFNQGSTDTLLLAELKWNVPDTTGLSSQLETIGSWFVTRMKVDTVAVKSSIYRAQEKMPESKGIKN